jgi:hypothetical protein
MCLHPEEIPPIPNETVRVAKAAFPKGNLDMRLRDELGVFYQALTCLAQLRLMVHGKQKRDWDLMYLIFESTGSEK